MSGKANVKSWEDRARLFLKAEIKRADITYQELATRLKAHGITENAYIEFVVNGRMDGNKTLSRLD